VTYLYLCCVRIKKEVKSMELKIGIIQEGKTPPDTRVPLQPDQAADLLRRNSVHSLLVQHSPNRCYSDAEYEAAGLPLVRDLSACDILLGVKEVPIDQLIADTTYFFFSHTMKKQEYNRDLLQSVIQKNIRLIDYEALTNEKGQRLIAFGRFAGMVGAHNALWTYAQRSGAFELPRLVDLKDYKEAKDQYSTLKLPAIKIVLTGMGRVGNGAAEVLRDMGVHEVDPESFLQVETDRAIFTQLDCADYAARKDGAAFDLKYFFDEPAEHISTFSPYTRAADIFINGIYWDNSAPAFFTSEEMRQQEFNLRVIADITCDIAPLASVPSTLRPSTIADPVYGYDPVHEKETAPYQEHSIDIMAIDNLPNELPRDASKAFGEQFLEHIAPELEKKDSAVLARATIAEKGALGSHFIYLENYLAGKE